MALQIAHYPDYYYFIFFFFWVKSEALTLVNSAATSVGSFLLYQIFLPTESFCCPLRALQWVPLIPALLSCVPGPWLCNPAPALVVWGETSLQPATAPSQLRARWFWCPVTCSCGSFAVWGRGWSNLKGKYLRRAFPPVETSVLMGFKMPVRDGRHF